MREDKCCSFTYFFYVKGFRRLQEFIITQHPLDSTIAEFWQMLWDHNVQTVVVLTAMDDQEYPVFWPSSQEGQDYDTFRVNNQQENDNNGLICRDFSLQSLQDDYDLTVKMVHCPMWPHSVPPPISSVLDLITHVQDCTRESHLGPVAVVDRWVLLRLNLFFRSESGWFIFSVFFLVIDLVEQRPPHFAV